MSGNKKQTVKVWEKTGSQGNQRFVWALDSPCSFEQRHWPEAGSRYLRVHTDAMITVCSRWLSVAMQWQTYPRTWEDGHHRHRPCRPARTAWWKHALHDIRCRSLQNCYGWWDGPSPEVIKESGSCGDSEDASVCFNDTLMNITRHFDEVIVVLNRYRTDSLKNRTRQYIESIPVTWSDKGKFDRIPGWENLGLQQRFTQVDYYLSGKPQKK